VTENLINDEWWTLLDHYGILLGDILMTFTLGMALFGFIKRNDLRNWLYRNHFPSIGGILDEQTRWQGLVFTVSRAEVPIWVMEKLQPASIGLLISDASQDYGKTIRQKAEQLGIIVFTETIHDPDDPAEANRKTKYLLQLLRENGIENIAVDITGGKTPMSIGAFMAAEEHQLDSIYVTAVYKDGKPDTSTAKIKAISQAQP